MTKLYLQPSLYSIELNETKWLVFGQIHSRSYRLLLAVEQYLTGLSNRRLMTHLWKTDSWYQDCYPLASFSPSHSLMSDDS